MYTDILSIVTRYQEFPFFLNLGFAAWDGVSALKQEKDRHGKGLCYVVREGRCYAYDFL
jgi:hypothetical protein